MRIHPFLLLAAVATAPAHAAIVMYEFTATVATGITVKDGDTGLWNYSTSSNVAGPTIWVGDTWTGTFSYDTELTLTAYQPEPPLGGSYGIYEGAMASTLSNPSTGLSYRSNGGYATMQVFDMAAGDYDSLSFKTNAFSTDFESSTFSFFDASGTALSGPTPPAGITLSDYHYATVEYTFSRTSDGDWMQAKANITSLTLVTTPVPEPSTYAMLGLGLGLLTFLSRKKARGDVPA